MEEFTGGGNTRSAACKIPSTDILSIEERLKSVLDAKLNNTDQQVMPEKQYVKVKE